MWSPSIQILMLCLPLLSTLVAANLGKASASDLASLNRSVGGLLIRGSPLSRPCFPRFNDHPNAADEAACSTVQNNYETPELRSQSFGAQMEVSRQFDGLADSRAHFYGNMRVATMGELSEPARTVFLRLLQPFQPPCIRELDLFRRKRPTVLCALIPSGPHY